MVNLDVLEKDRVFIQRIVTRAAKMHDMGLKTKKQRQSLEMDLAAVHLNGCPLDFPRLLEAPDFDFRHDVRGIPAYIDRRTGTLTEHFDPRCSVPVADEEVAYDEETAPVGAGAK